MHAELLSVGTELLLGQIVDTNAAYLADKLSELGINVYYKTTVGDNTQRLAAALRISLGRADVVLATGGLGPTEDDVTAAAVADVAGVVDVVGAADVVDVVGVEDAQAGNRMTNTRIKVSRTNSFFTAELLLKIFFL